jgi:hypothetical protein
LAKSKKRKKGSPVTSEEESESSEAEESSNDSEPVHTFESEPVHIFESEPVHTFETEPVNTFESCYIKQEPADEDYETTDLQNENSLYGFEATMYEEEEQFHSSMQVVS